MAKKNGKGKGGQADAKGKTAKPQGTKQAGSLAAIIDPFLLAGNNTVKEIAAELGKKAGEAAKGKDLQANVRARLVSYRRKGWQVVKDETKLVKVLQP